MISYTQAQAHYNKCQAPKHSKKWLAMPDSPRYLSNVSMTHYGIHKKTDGTIYYRLYDTNLVTLSPPNENGEYQVDIKYVNTQTTSKFMWWHGLHYNSFDVEEGKRVLVPYVHKGGWRDALTTARLVFDASDKLIVDSSWHEPIYTKVSSPEDKAKRKYIRQSIKNLVMLNEFRLPMYRDNAKVESNLGQPFATARGAGPTASYNLRRYINTKLSEVRDPLNFNFSSDEFIELFMEAGQDVFNVLASQRAYKEGRIKWISKWQKTQEEIDELYRIQRLEHSEVINGISGEDFNRSFVNMLLNLFHLKEGTDYKDWGQFRDTLPYKWFVK